MRKTILFLFLSTVIFGQTRKAYIDSTFAWDGSGNYIWADLMRTNRLVDTKAAMETLTGVSVGKVVFLKELTSGYGGGPFVAIDSTAKTVPDSGIYFPTPKASIVWARVAYEYGADKNMNPAWFGATPNDTSINSTSAIQKILNLSEAQYPILNITSIDTFGISSLFVTRGNVHFKDMTLFYNVAYDAGEQNYAVFINSDTSGVTAGDSLVNITFDNVNIQIAGNITSAGSVLAQNVNKLSFINQTYLFAKSNGVSNTDCIRLNTPGSCENVTIRDVEMVHTGLQGHCFIFYNVTNLTMEHVKASNTNKGFIGLVVDDSRNVHFNEIEANFGALGIRFEDITDSTAHFSIKNSEFVHNDIDAGGAEGIRISQGVCTIEDVRVITGINTTDRPAINMRDPNAGEIRVKNFFSDSQIQLVGAGLGHRRSIILENIDISSAPTDVRGSILGTSGSIGSLVVENSKFRQASVTVLTGKVTTRNNVVTTGDYSFYAKATDGANVSIYIEKDSVLSGLMDIRGMATEQASGTVTAASANDTLFDTGGFAGWTMDTTRIYIIYIKDGTGDAQSRIVKERIDDNSVRVNRAWSTALDVTSDWGMRINNSITVEDCSITHTYGADSAGIDLFYANPFKLIGTEINVQANIGVAARSITRGLLLYNTIYNTSGLGIDIITSGDNHQVEGGLWLGNFANGGLDTTQVRNYDAAYNRSF